MPRLLVFLPCELVLLDQDNSVSVIHMMNEVTLSGDFPDPLPARAAVQVRWSTFAQWEASAEEVGQHFEQRVQMVRDGVVAFENMSDFTIEAGKPIHRMISNFTFFPIVPGGAYRLGISIRRVGTEEWQECGDYPLTVVYRHIQVPTVQA